MPFPVNLGAIDAGSNAIRVVVATASSPTQLTRIEAERIAVRLGHGAFTRGELDPQVIDAAVEAFVGFRAMFDRHGVAAYRAVGTSALRTASNGDVVLHRIYHEAGIELEVIDGEEEARLVRLAVAHAFGEREQPQAILDLGGGSLEVNLRQGRRWDVASLPIGTVRLMESLELTGAIDEREASVIRRNVAALLHTVTQRGGERAPAAACGGNADALAALFGKPHKGMPSFRAKDLEKALPELLAADVEERMQTHAVRRDRAEVMGVAALIFAEACKELGIARVYVPGAGIREALLLETAEMVEKTARSEKARRHALLAAARTFANRVGHDTTHAEHVRRLAHALFAQLAPLHGLRDELSAVLEVAALLHDVGVVVHGRGHHKHGEYMVLNGRIPGLESPQREMVAAMVRGHRKSLPAPDKHETYASLAPEHQHEVRRLGALLRLADGLDHDHRQRVHRLDATARDGEVALTLELRPGVTPPEPPPPSKRALLEQELDVRVTCSFEEAVS